MLVGPAYIKEISIKEEVLIIIVSPDNINLVI